VLRSTAISLEGLTKSEVLTNLTQLDIGKTSISADDIAGMKQKWPKVQFIR
jgi:hypothetical protein